MIIIGCDYHPGFQQIAFVDTDSGEWNERRLGHREEAEQFYRQLQVRGKKVRVGMEASGHARWFERLLTELQFELWIGDAAEIRAKRVRKQKTDRQDAELLLRLLMEDRFPRIWVADGENRDLRQLLWHRHRLVQMRTRIMNQLHVLALNEGVRRKKALWRPAGRAQLQSLVLARWASRRRPDLLELLDQLTPKIQELTRALEQEVEKRRLGHISKQGNSLLRFLLVEAAQVTVRTDPDWRRRFLHLAMRRERRIAKVAMARKLAVRLYWMWHKEWDYEQMRKFGSHVGEPGNRQGAS